MACPESVSLGCGPDVSLADKDDGRLTSRKWTRSWTSAAGLLPHLHSAWGPRAVQAGGWALRTLGLCKAGAPAEPLAAPAVALWGPRPAALAWVL